MIRFQDVTFGYPNKQALFENFSFEIEESCTTGIIGPNGSGKSTLFSLIMNWQKPHSGRRYLQNKPLENYTPNDLSKKIAWLPADTPIPPFHFTVQDILNMGRYPFQNWIGKITSNDDAIIHDITESLNLTHLLKNPIDTLSSGEWQRTQIAKAYIQTPQLLLLDEPFTHQDTHNTALITQHIKNSSITTLLISHDKEQIQLLCKNKVLL